MSYDFLTFIALIFSVIAGFFTFIKFYSDLKKEISNQNIEIVNFKIEVSSRLSKIENKLDISDIQYHNTNETIKLTNQTTTQRVDKLEVELKEQQAEIKTLRDKLFDILKDNDSHKVATH